MAGFQGFEASYIPVHSKVVGDIKIHCLQGGSAEGPVLVLLHGYPQTYYIWHRIAQKLVNDGYNVIIPDLRGYGLSDKPKGSESHIEYSKREMAADIVAVARHYKVERFNLIAHDRGARVAHRVALDWPQAIQKLMILDIAPTLYMYENTDQEFATKYWHWFMNLTPKAEEIILANPEAYFDQCTRSWPGFAPEARAEYFKHFSTPEGVHGSCEDYRAAASIDLDHDREDRAKGVKLAVPEIAVFWGSQGLIPKYGDVIGVWKSYSQPSVKISGRALDCNHYIPEGASEELYREILSLVPVKNQ